MGESILVCWIVVENTPVEPLDVTPTLIGVDRHQDALSVCVIAWDLERSGNRVALPDSPKSPVSTVLSAAVAMLDSWIGGLIPGWVIAGYVLSYGISLGLVAIVLAAIFKILPDVKISWRDVWIGALVTSVLFHIGKFGISLYIGKASVASTFGAAGSLAVLLVWIYYSSQIVLFGAEFTRVYANEYGSRIVADDNAVPVPESPLARAAMEKKIEKGEVPDVPPNTAPAAPRR